MIKLLKTFGIIFALSACSSAGQIKINNDNWIPCRQEVKRIENLPYVAGEFDCKHKAALLVDFYRKHGYKAIMISSGKSSGFTRYNFMLFSLGHAQVLVINPKDYTCHLIDPTDKTNIDGEKVNLFEYVTRIVNGEAVEHEIKIANKYLKNN